MTPYDPWEFENVGPLWYCSHMNKAEAIECPAHTALGTEEFDKQAFTTRRRAEKLAEQYCDSCPVQVECLDRHSAFQAVARDADGKPTKIVGLWGGQFFE